MVDVLIFSYSILFYMAFTRRLLQVHAVVGSLIAFGIGCIELYHYLQGTLRGIYYVNFIIEVCFLCLESFISYTTTGHSKSINSG